MDDPLTRAFQVTAALSRRAVAPDDDGCEPLCALLSISAEPGPRPAIPVELCLVLDASGSMHRFHLDAEQRELWRRIAEERGDLLRDRADGYDGWLWSGETLREMRGLIQTPMAAVVRSLAALAKRLSPDDRLTIVAFADTTEALLARAGAVEREQGLAAALDRLARGVDDSGLGRGSRLAEALRLARRFTPADPSRARRIVLVSDGVVEDGAACLREVETAADEGTIVSAVGVGDEFDEELLMRIADDTRGRYAYAPAASDLEAALADEVDAAAHVAARRLTITIQPEREVVFRELFQVAPAVSRFNTLWMESGGVRYRLGDLARGQTIQLLAELALPPADPGANPVACVRVAAEGETAATALTVKGSADPQEVWERDGTVIAAMEAVQAYLGERRAHHAAARADLAEATRQLRHTTRILRRMGQAGLAGDFEGLAADLEAGRTASLTRTKRLKAATRRLASEGAERPAGVPAAAAPRDLVHNRDERTS